MSPRAERLVALAAALGVAFLMASQAFAQPATPDPDPATFTLALNGRPQTFDPREVVRTVESRVIYNLFEGLYMPPMGEGAAVPAVASSHEVSDDGLTYTFHLRPEARWSNGDPVTAQDFVTAWQRVLTPGQPGPYTYLMHGVKNGRAFAEGTIAPQELGVTAVDDYTLRVELEEPIPFFIELTAFTTFFPVHTASVSAHGDAAFALENLVTNGPYAVASLDETELRLVQNESYWDRDALSIATVSMRFFPTEEESLQAYLEGQVEWLSELPWQRLSSLRFRNDFATHPMFGTYYLRVNATAPVFSDPRVRQALSLAIDRDALCRHVLDDLCHAANSFVPPMPDFQPVGILAYSPERARELLFEAGYDGENPFPQLRLLFNSLELHQRVVEAIAEMWRANLGIEISLVEAPWDSYLAALDDMEYEVARVGWVGDYLDPETFLYLMHGSNPRMNGGWSNPAYDEIMRQASTERDAALRRELLRSAEAILLNELPVLPLFYYEQYQLIRPYVRGFEMNLRDVHLVRYIARSENGAQ